MEKNVGSLPSSTPPGFHLPTKSSSCPRAGGRGYLLTRAGDHIPSILWANLSMGCWSCCCLCIVSSSLEFIFPCASKVASLCCHTPSRQRRASSASCLPSCTQSIICTSILFKPCWAKCLPRGVDSSLTSNPWPTCLLCINCVVLPLYCFPHCAQVTK